MQRKLTRAKLRRMLLREASLLEQNLDNISKVANINAGDITGDILDKEEKMEVIAANIKILRDAIIEIQGRLLKLEQKSTDR